MLLGEQEEKQRLTSSAFSFMVEVPPVVLKPFKVPSPTPVDVITWKLFCALLAL